MAMIKYLSSVFALITTAFAQCSTSGTTTIAASADVTALASCTTYSGSVAIPTGLAVSEDSAGRQALRVDNIRRITGNLTVTDINVLSSLTFGSLQTVSGLELSNLERLTDLSFPQLTTLDVLNFTVLPLLESLDFGSQGITKAKSIYITNTGLASLRGIDNLEEVDLFDVNNNRGLRNISLQVISITNTLSIYANDGYESGLTTSFPLLETAQYINFRNCSQILLPSLRNVTDDLGFYGNSFTSFTAPRLTTAGGINFVGNTELQNISMARLEKINGPFSIVNNTKLDKIDGFQNLSVITGTLDLSGNFSEVDLPALTQEQGGSVQGAFNIQTSEEIDCSKFEEARRNKVIRGEYVCIGSQVKPGTAGTTPSSTSSGSGSSESGAATALDLSLSLVMGGSSLVVTFLQLFL